MSSMSHSWVRTTALFFWVRKGYPATAIAIIAMCWWLFFAKWVVLLWGWSAWWSTAWDPRSQSGGGTMGSETDKKTISWSSVFVFLISNGTNYLMLWLLWVSHPNMTSIGITDCTAQTWLAYTSSRCQLRGYRLSDSHGRLVLDTSWDIFLSFSID